MRTKAAVGLLAGAALLAGCSGAGGSAVPLPPPPTFIPGDLAPPPSPASAAAPVSPFANVAATTRPVTGFGATEAQFVAPAGASVTAIGLTNGHISSLTLTFSPAAKFYDALRRVTAVLPSDTTIRYVQSPGRLCRQVEFRSLLLTQAYGVSAVLVEFKGLSTKRFFKNHAVVSARFSPWPLGDRTAPC
jgi:hypothetical protein